MLNAGQFYTKDSKQQSESELVNAAISGLKLDVIDEFIPENNIIEWTLSNSRR